LRDPGFVLGSAVEIESLISGRDSLLKLHADRLHAAVDCHIDHSFPASKSPNRRT